MSGIEYGIGRFADVAVEEGNVINPSECATVRTFGSDIGVLDVERAVVVSLLACISLVLGTVCQRFNLNL
ncbi:MAG: hypothetical protein MJZ29_07765 [Bacteroidaceae bacterium]|nr:hypothetical protein [Bacteroidaceae bacterium]